MGRLEGGEGGGIERQSDQFIRSFDALSGSNDMTTLRVPHHT